MRNKAIKNIQKGLNRLAYITKAEPKTTVESVATYKNAIPKMLGISSQLRVLHWQTRVYAEHKALGDYYETFNGLLDEFIETFQGQFGTIEVAPGNMSLFNYTDIGRFFGDIQGYVRSISETIQIVYDSMPQSDDLKNIMDELVGETNKLSYLLTLK